MAPEQLPKSLEECVRRLLAPAAFFLGLIVGFIACCVAGRVAADRVVFRDFQRFETPINPEGLYYPTALQVRALARRQLPKDKIAVIIGGSSVMQGHGQTRDGLWTRHLQELLGEEYRVLNLAMPGGAPTEYGQAAAEMLFHDHPRILHVCDCGMHCFSQRPEGNRDAYRYLYYDVRARGLQLQFPQREAVLRALKTAPADDTPQAEIQFQARANEWCSFNDLWHVIAYRHFFTIWNSAARPRPFAPRRQVSAPKHPLKYLYEHYDLGVEEQHMLGAAARYDAAAWARFEAGVRASVPEPLRPKTLAVVNRFSPYYFRVLRAKDPELEGRFGQKIQEALRHLRACGLSAVEGCTTLDEDDFMDRCHLLESGGEKLARELAPAIRALARRLNYLSGAKELDRRLAACEP